MRSPRRGEIYRLKTDPASKPRPLLIVSPVHLNGGLYVSGVPFYSQQVEKRRSFRTCVFFATSEFGLEKERPVYASHGKAIIFRNFTHKLFLNISEIDDTPWKQKGASDH